MVLAGFRHSIRTLTRMLSWARANITARNANMKKKSYLPSHVQLLFGDLSRSTQRITQPDALWT